MMVSLDNQFEETVDLLVFGGGAAGMTAALTAALEGLSVTLCEKTDMVGGTSATSGGTTWVPGTALSVAAGVPDKTSDADQFLKSVVGLRGGEELRDAFLRSGAKAIEELDARTDVKFDACLAHPDYLGNHPGAAYGGRALTPKNFDGRLLGKDFVRVRPPHKEFMGLGGMMVARGELPALLKPFRSWGNLRTSLSILLRYFKDRITHNRGTRLLMGNALVARLLYSLNKQGVAIQFETSLVELLKEDDRIVGAMVESPRGRKVIRARRGVVLATGGIAWNKALREKLLPKEAAPRSLAPETNTGDGVSVALKAGAVLDNGHDSPALWMPCSTMKHANGTQSVWPHIILDRAKPGLIAVSKSGNRFVNESDSYHDFCMGMIRAGLTEAWLICDATFVRDHGLGLILPGTRNLKPYEKAGYLRRGASLTDLAQAIGVDAAKFEETVARHNRFAQSGNDEDFGRGTSVMNRFNGDANNRPNPCMRPIANAPFYAVEVKPMDLASSAGLKGDIHGRVLSATGEPIAGLYGCGNDMTSIFRGTYPGPGTTLGPAIVFGWRIGKHAAGRLTE